jgi:hypothetical protein
MYLDENTNFYIILLVENPVFWLLVHDHLNYIHTMLQNVFLIYVCVLYIRFEVCHEGM